MEYPKKSTTNTNAVKSGSKILHLHKNQLKNSYIYVILTAYRSTSGPMTVTTTPTADSQLISAYQQSAVEKGWPITDCSGPNITG